MTPMSEMQSFVLSDASVVLADEVLEHGWVVVADGSIVEIGTSRPPEVGLSLDGDLLIPGLIELHTDHLESHIEPRPNVDWHPNSAVISYDAQIAAAGITTVFDCLRLGADRNERDEGGARAIRIADTLSAEAARGNLRAEHRTHLRCELCSRDVVDAARNFLSGREVGILSLMDHTPGQRQFRDINKLRAYYLSKLQMSENELQKLFDERYRLHQTHAVDHRRALVDMARSRGITLASHDDTTIEHVQESVDNGAVIAEFPTTFEAAEASHAARISVVMGAPNLIRGGSHSGNVAASELAEAGLLDIFSSDYIPASLLMAAFALPKHNATIDLPAALATVTSSPARAAGLADRGEIAVGKRADLVRVRSGETPIVRTVWREGNRVF
ncbi:MAG: alpha-D-ribose 1-methylphosphonate 5-triphosphate diphosphatase [Hyphomicrobiaceae bacterium]